MKTNEPSVDHDGMMKAITALMALAGPYAQQKKGERRRVKQKHRNEPSRQAGRLSVYFIGASPRHEWYYVEIEAGTYALGRRLALPFTTVVIEDWDFWSYFHDVSCEVMCGFYAAVKSINEWREESLQPS